MECGFCLSLKSKIKKIIIQLFLVYCGVGTCGSQIFHCTDCRKQEKLFVCQTVFGTNFTEYIERQTARGTAYLFSSTVNLYISSEITFLSCCVEMTKKLNFISSSEKWFTFQLGIHIHQFNILFQDILSLGELLTSYLCNALLVLHCFNKSRHLSVLFVG